MPKKYAQGVKLIKRRNKFFLLMFALVLLVAVVFAGEGLASLIRYGSISVFGKSSASSYTLYALSFGMYDSEVEAETMASAVSVRGAGAYIYKHNGKCYVLGCVYPTNDSASKVASDIKEYKCEVVPIKFNKVKVDIANATKQDKKVVDDSLQFLKSMYTNMYDNVIKLDTGDITNIACSNNVNYLKAEAKVQVANVMRVNANMGNTKLASICNAYIKVIDSLDNLVNKLLQSNSVSYVAKYTLCEIVAISQNLYNEL